MIKLYKYVSFSTGKIVLENQNLRWSTPPLLNDPFDMQFLFQVRADRGAVKLLALQKLWVAHYGPGPVASTPNQLGVLIGGLQGSFPQLSREEFDCEFGEAIDECFEVLYSRLPDRAREIWEIFQNDKILCLSEVPDSIVMWSYYAQNHAGMVLCFRDAVGPDGPWRMARPVSYVDEVPSLFTEDALSEILAGQHSIDLPHVLDMVCFTKSRHWEHEREWRIYAGAGRTQGPYEDIPFNALELDSVILGCRMPKQERMYVVDLISRRYLKTVMFQAVTRSDAYALNIVPF
jgi:hypothetical protein